MLSPFKECAKLSRMLSWKYGCRGWGGGGALIPPRTGAQVKEGYTNFNVVQRSAVDSLFKCPEKICNRF